MMNICIDDLSELIGLSRKFSTATARETLRMTLRKRISIAEKISIMAYGDKRMATPIMDIVISLCRMGKMDEQIVKIFAYLGFTIVPSYGG